MRPLCSPCLCGVFCSAFVNHRVTEDTEFAQRKSAIQSFLQSRTHPLPQVVLTVSKHVDHNKPDFRLGYGQYHLR